jgi:branched-chain amino acid transport system ATP-binding protein
MLHPHAPPTTESDERSLILETRGLNGGYGSSQVLYDIDFQAPRTGLVAVLGRNGAGKSTLLNTITGVLRPFSGQVVIDGVETTGFRTDRIARLGVGYVPQEQAVFAALTVAENLRVGSFAGSGSTSRMDEVLDLFPILKRRLRQRAGTLSGGERKMLAISRALLGEPKILLLDEPTEGVWPAVVEEIGDRLASLSADRSIVLVEQQVAMALRIADQVYVLDRGRVALAGPADSVANDPVLYRFLAP